MSLGCLQFLMESYLLYTFLFGGLLSIFAFFRKTYWFLFAGPFYKLIHYYNTILFFNQQYTVYFFVDEDESYMKIFMAVKA